MPREPNLGIQSFRQLLSLWCRSSFQFEDCLVNLLNREVCRARLRSEQVIQGKQRRGAGQSGSRGARRTSSKAELPPTIVSIRIFDNTSISNPALMMRLVSSFPEASQLGHLSKPATDLDLFMRSRR